MRMTDETIIDAEEEELPSSALIATEPRVLPTSSQAISTLNPADYQELLMPALSVDESVRRFEMFGELVSKLLVEGKDYGLLPGTQEPSFRLPGAEKLATFFGLQISVSLIAGERERKEEFPWFYYAYKATAFRGGNLIVECEGSCNSYEEKYRYVWVKLPPPSKLEQDQLKAEGKGKWFEWDGVSTWKERRFNPNPFMLDNTIRKMAQVRAYRGVVEKATGASSYFAKGSQARKPAQQKAGEPARRAMPGRAGQINALREGLGWADADLLRVIAEEFQITPTTDDLGAILTGLVSTEQDRLIQKLKAELQQRQRTAA